MNKSRNPLADREVCRQATGAAFVGRSTAARREPWRRLVLCAALVTLALAAPAAAVTPVDCNTPNDFCTGDPCVTKDELQITVPSCVLDFGARALVLAQVVFVQNGGSLTLSAGSIEIRRRIDGRHIKAAAGDGSDITLHSLGDIMVRKRVDAAGRNSTGTIVLTAGGDVVLHDQLRARAKGHGATAAGGNVTVQAGGAVMSTHKGKIDVHGRINRTAGGDAAISGQAGVSLKSKIDARGATAGGVTVTSAAGSIALEEEISADGLPGGGGNITVNAAGTVSTMKILNASGGMPGAGSIALTGGGAMSLTDLRADGRLGAPAGSAGATAGSLAIESVRVRGGGPGGVVNLFSTAGDIVVDRIDARGKAAAGGFVTVSSAGDLVNSTSTKVNGDTQGGEAHFTAVGDITLGEFKTSRFDATSGVGGVLEAHATGSLVASGHFDAATGGCIGLSATGALDTTAVEADGPISASCP